MKIYQLILLLLMTVFNLANAMASDEVRFRCTSSDKTHILPFGDDSLLDVEINSFFGGYLSIAGDAGIWSHLKYFKKQNLNIIFISVEPESNWQAKDLEAVVNEDLLNGKPGEIHFTNLADPKITKHYTCQ